MSIELPGYVVDLFYFIGLPWPGVDEDQLKGWGNDLRAFAEEIDTIAGLSRDAVAELAHSDQSAFLKTLAGNWEQHRGTIMALRGPMNAFADALDVAAAAVTVQKGVVIGAAVALAAEVAATQGEALVTFGLAEAEVPLEVAGTKMVIKFALQELENALLGALINDAAQAVSTHLDSSIGKLLMGGLGVAGEGYALKTDTSGIRNLAKTIGTHAHRTELTSEGAYRRTTNRALETESPGGRWHVVAVLEAALLSIAADLFKKLPGTLFQVMEKTEEDLTKAAEAIEEADARLAADAPAEAPAAVPMIGGGGGPPEEPPVGKPATGGGNPEENPGGNPQDGPGGEPGPADTPRRRSKMPPKDTPEGKEARWKRYQNRVAAGKVKKPLEYAAWSKKYDVAIYQAERANAKVDDYVARSGLTTGNGWVKEHSIQVGDRTRRLDIANPATMEGIEYKAGAVPNDEKLAAEIENDHALIATGWRITWVFRVTPAPWLQDRLKSQGIPWRMDGGGTPPH